MSNYYQILIKLDHLSNELLSNHPEPTRMKEGLLLYAIAKSTKTIEAIKVLCEKGMGEDATILCRSLLELTVIVEYILQDETDQLVKRYFSFDWIQRRKMMKILEQSTEAKKISEETMIVEEIKREAGEADKEFEYNYGWSSESIGKMFTAVGKNKIYDTVYNIQCSFCHSNPRTMNDYIKIENNQLVLQSGPSANLVKETLVITCSAYYELLFQFNKFFKKNLDEELKSFEEEFKEEIRLDI